MVIALLAVLGVNLIVLVAFAAVVISRKRWVNRRTGAFRGVVRVAERRLGPYRTAADTTAAESAEL